MRFKNLKVMQVNFESQILEVFCNCRVNIVELVNYIESFESKDTGIEESEKAVNDNPNRDGCLDIIKDGWHYVLAVMCDDGTIALTDTLVDAIEKALAERKSKKTEPKGYHDVDKFYRDQSKEVIEEIRSIMMTYEITDSEKCICEIRKLLNNS